MQDQTSTIFPERPVIYATFSERFAAMFIDGIVVSILQWVTSLVLQESFNSLIDNLAALIVYWLYDSLQISGTRQATLGKRAMGIKVVSMDNQRISFMQATGRYLGQYVSFVILLIGYFMMLWDSRHQTLHDKLAGTLVLSTKV
jgi:uncharacterized RDD family membrane protein YckC